MGKLRGFRTINIMFFIEQQKYWVLLKWVKGSPKKTVNFEDIVIKGGWVLVSKPNFFYITNRDICIYQMWVGVKHRCHKFIHSKFTFELSTLPLTKCINCLFDDPYP